MAGGDQGRKPNTRSGSSTTETESCKCTCSNEFREIKRYLEEMNMKLLVLGDLKQTVENLEKTVTFISSQYDTIVKVSEKNKNDIVNLNKEIANLTNINNNNQTKIKHLTDKINFADQYSRNVNLEIHGITEVPNEDCKDLITKIAQKLELPITRADIDVAHRLTTKQNKQPPAIIAQFSSRTKRDQLLKKKKIVVTDSSFPATSIGTTIYLNENIAPYYKNLYRLAKIQAKVANFQFVWFKNCKLLIRKNSSSPVHKINCEEDIPKYMSETSA